MEQTSLGRVGRAKEPLPCEWKGKSSVVSEILVALGEWGRFQRGIATLKGSRRRGRKGSRAPWGDCVILFMIWQKPEMTTGNSESEGGWHFKLKRFIVC